MDMRGSPVVDAVAPWIRTGFDRPVDVVAVAIRQGAPAAAKIRIDRRNVVVVAMTVAAACVGLPHFDQRIRHAASELVEHMPVDDDPFADRQAALRIVEDQVVVELAELVRLEHRRGNLRQRILQGDECVARRAEHARLVRRCECGRMLRAIARVELAARVSFVCHARQAFSLRVFSAPTGA